MNTHRYSFDGKNSTDSFFFPKNRCRFWRVSAKLALMAITAFCLSPPYYAAATRVISAGVTEDIPGSQTSPWTITDNLVVNGTMEIKSNGQVNNFYGYIGFVAGDLGVVTVDGAGAAWNNDGELLIGFQGDGSLAISNGAEVSNLNGSIGRNTGSSGVVTVDGSGSRWANSGILYIGYFGDGSLTISNGGYVSNVTGYIGALAGSSGVVAVDGGGSTWANSGHLYIGYNGPGSLDIINGAEVSNNKGYIGVSSGFSGTVKVDGANSIWYNSETLSIGRSGTGTLAISGGAQVNSSDAYIGEQLTGLGKVTVGGDKSKWDIDGDLYIGLYGIGSFAISGGAEVNNLDGVIGAYSTGSGTVTADGGSIWANSGDLYIGYYGPGSLAISGGAKVSNAIGFIGAESTGSGLVTVDGGGSTWANDATLIVGYLGTGTLAISNNGLVSAETVIITGLSGSSGSLGVSSGGILEARALTAGEGSVVAATFDGGTLRATAANPAFIIGFGPSELVIKAGGLTIDDNGYGIATDSSAFSGIGGLTKIGVGTLTLGGLNSYSGDTLVAEGALKAGADDVFSRSSAFKVEAGATLDLDGYNQSIAALINSGEVRFGSETSSGPVGATLTVNGNYESDGGSLYLRTTLGDDSSLTDKLIVDTVTTGAGGATSMYIINVGGLGALTAANGVEIVEVMTSSTSDAFVLGAAVTAGVNEYVLSQGADESWYLTSFASDESSDGVFYNPNIGSYLGNQYAAAMMFNQNILDRQNSVRSPDQTIWLRTNYNRVKSDILGGRQSVKVKTALIQLGVDLFKNNDFIAGVYTGYGHSNIDNRSRQTGTRADGKVDGFHIGTYFSWVPEKDQGPYIDLWAYYAWYDNELSGAAQPWGKAKYDSTGYGLSGEAGYGFELRRFANGRALILEPHLQLMYINIDADNFTDRHGTRYTNNKGGGCQTRVGARLYGQPSRGEIGVKPFVELNWLHNDVDSGIRLDNEYINSDIGRNVGEVKIGLQGQATKNLNIWGHIEAQSGQSSFDRYGAQVGLALQW